MTCLPCYPPCATASYLPCTLDPCMASGKSPWCGGLPCFLPVLPLHHRAMLWEAAAAWGCTG